MHRERNPNVPDARSLVKYGVWIGISVAAIAVIAAIAAAIAFAPDVEHFFQYIAWIGTTVAATTAAIALLFNAKANRANTRVQRAAFWLQIRTMFNDHNDVYMALQEGGDWYRSDKEPHDPKKFRKIIPYLSLFEQCQALIEEGLLDKETIHKTQIPYRVRLILQNGPIKRELLHGGRKDEKPKWKTFERLVNDFQVYLDDFEYCEMFKNPNGGPPETVLCASCNHERKERDRAQATSVGASS